MAIHTMQTFFPELLCHTLLLRNLCIEVFLNFSADVCISCKSCKLPGCRRCRLIGGSLSKGPRAGGVGVSASVGSAASGSCSQTSRRERWVGLPVLFD
jgi:hypothetical protein